MQRQSAGVTNSKVRGHSAGSVACVGVAISAEAASSVRAIAVLVSRVEILLLRVGRARCDMLTRVRSRDTDGGHPGYDASVPPKSDAAVLPEADGAALSRRLYGLPAGMPQTRRSSRRVQALRRGLRADDRRGKEGRGLIRLGWTARVVGVVGASVLFGTVAPACSRGVPYVGRGEVISIDQPRLHAIIRHEDIPGLMAAMTMRFTVASQAVLDGIQPGDPVSFVLLQRGGDLTLLSVTRRAADRPSSEEGRAVQ